MDKDKYTLDTPDIQNNWVVFPNAVFGQIGYTTCGDTPCFENGTLEDCKNKAKDKMGGYYVKGPNSSLCMVLEHDTERNYQPYHAIRPSHLYDELSGYRTTAFVNKDVYPFPPVNETGLLTYRDNFSLQNVKTKKILSLEDDREQSLLVFYVDGRSELELLPLSIPIPYINYRIPVANNSNVIITIPNTSMLIRPNNNTLEWAIRVAVVNNPDNAFTIHNQSRPESKTISFEDSVYFTYGDKTIGYNEQTDTLFLGDNPENRLFNLIPKRSVYYLENGVCKKVGMNETEIQQGKATYNGIPTVRRSTCWTNIKPEQSNVPYFITLGLILLGVVIMLKLPRFN